MGPVSRLGTSVFGTSVFRSLNVRCWASLSPALSRREREQKSPLTQAAPSAPR